MYLVMAMYGLAALILLANVDGALALSLLNCAGTECLEAK
jgi:hypothetical protein